MSHGISCAEVAGTGLEVGEVALAHLKRVGVYTEDQGGRALDSSSLYGVVRVDTELKFKTELVKRRDEECDD